MEFISHFPQEINKDGVLWQTWNSFYRKCHLYQSSKIHASMGDACSLLLFAGNHHISFICSSLKMYDLDLEKLTKILHIVEQACLPYLILLFERFRYYRLKHDLSGSLNDDVILQKQAEMCEFNDPKDSFMTDQVLGLQLQETGLQLQHTPDPDRLNLCNQNSRTERSHGNIMNDKSGRVEITWGINTATVDVGQEKCDLSNSDRSLQDTDNSSSVDPQTVAAGDSYFCTGKSRYISFGPDRKNSSSKLTGALKKWKLRRKMKLIRAKKTQYVSLEDLEKESAVADSQNISKNGTVSMQDSAIDVDGSMIHLLLKSSSVAGHSVNFKQFPCCLCNRVFAGQNCFKKHLILKHKGCSEFVCRICKATYVDAEKYVVHYTKTHTVEQKRTRARREVAVRIKGKEDVRRFHCTICRKAFRKKGYLNRHIHYSHKQSFLCWHCGENLPSLPDYKQHSEKHVIIGRFVCDMCQRPYNSIFRLIGHMKNHLLPQNKCEICGIAFMKQESLTKHMEKHIDEPAHRCKICGKTFVMQGRLQCHMRTHSGEKRFTCELCGKSYAQKVNLIHHKRWHAGEQPYECEICGKRTRSSGDLNKHKRKHSDKYSYVCEMCGRGFNYSSALVKHRLGHSGKRSYACDVCGRTFIYREGLRDHIKASRCPGRIETGVKRTPRATKLLLSEVPDALVDVEAKAFNQAAQGSDAGLKDVPDWHCMLKNNESDGGSNVVLVPSFY